MTVTVKISEICTTTQGVQITKLNTSDTPYDGGYRYLYIADFISDSNLSFVDDKFDGKKVTENDLVMANTGSPGRVFKGKDGILSNNLFKISFDLNIVNRDYLFLMLSSNIFQHSLQQQMKGGIQKHLGHKTIARQDIPLPPLAEQQKIAAILDAADSLRQKDQQLVAHYTALSQSLFLEMFGDPVTNPMNWEMLRLGETGKWASGGTPDRKVAEYFEGDIPWVTSGELNSIYISDSKEHISESSVINSSAKIVEEGSLLLGMYDTAALKSSITTKPMSCNQAIASAKLDSTKVNTTFVYYLIQIAKEHYRRMQRGVRQKNLNLTMIKEFEILKPPVALQNQFSDKIKLIEAQKQQAQAALEKSEALFNSLLHGAFTGELSSEQKAA